MIDVYVDNKKVLDELAEKIRAFGQELDLNQIMGEVAVDQLARIETRTLAGVDFEEQPFESYSKSYAAFRKKPPKGLSPRPTDKVDLFFTGQMFGAMDWETVEDGVRLFFNDTTAAAKAHSHHYGYKPNKLPARPFFEASDDDAVKIREQMADAIEEIRNTFFR